MSIVMIIMNKLVHIAAKNENLKFTVLNTYIDIDNVNITDKNLFNTNSMISGILLDNVRIL